MDKLLCSGVTKKKLNSKIVTILPFSIRAFNVICHVNLIHFNEYDIEYLMIISMFFVLFCFGHICHLMLSCLGFFVSYGLCEITVISSTLYIRKLGLGSPIYCS